MGQGDLDLVGSEEAARAGVDAVAEANVLGRGADEVGSVLLGRPPHLHEAVGVPSQRLGVGALVQQGFAPVHPDLGTLLDGKAVLELDVSYSLTLEVSWGCVRLATANGVITKGGFSG